MKLNFKTFAIGFAALLGVLVLALALFFVFFPKQLAAREAEKRIEEATGRELILGDNIDITFWPALGFSVDKISLSNPEGFSTETPFIAAERLVFAVKLIPLLAGAIEVKQLIFEDAELNLEVGENGAANWLFPTEQSAPEQQFTLEDLRLDDVRLIDGAINFKGEGEPMRLDDVDVRLALQSLDQPAQLDAALTYREQRLEIEAEIGLPRAVLEQGQTPIQARLRSSPLNASLDGAFNAATGALTGKIEADGASLRQLLAWIGSPLGQGGGFGRFRVAAQLAHAGQETALTDASLSLDGIDASGRLALITQANGRLRIDGALDAGIIDVNPYLPAPAQGAAGGVEVDAVWPNTPLDLSGLRALDANLALTLDGLKFQRMSFADVAVSLRVANGAADARLTRVSLYQGAGAARLIADGSGATPRIAVELDVQNIQAETLLRDSIGFDRIVGRGRLRASLVGQGATQAALMRAWSGSASFNFNDGQWKGVNFAQMARALQQALSGQAAGEGGATDFAELAASFSVANGVAATQDLRLLNPFVRLEGTGLVDIGAQTIDMRLVPRAVRSAQGQGGDLAVAGLGVPFRVSGPWTHVSFAPALGDVVQNQLRARAQAVLRDQGAGNPLVSLGEALFGRPAENAPAPAEGAPPTEAAQPEAQPPAETPRNPLEDMLRRATQPREPAPEPAP